VQRCSRVYRGTWKHNGSAHDVVVKVVSRHQAAHEARVLKAVSVRPEARAIQVLAQVPVNGPNDDVGLVTPYCSGGQLFEGAASVHDVLRQAVQLCEVRYQVVGFHCCCAIAHAAAGTWSWLAVVVVAARVGVGGAGGAGDVCTRR